VSINRLSTSFNFINKGVSLSSGEGDTSQNVRFVDDSPQWRYSIDGVDDGIRSVADTPDVSLADFMARPVKIAQYAWAVGAVPVENLLNPWQEFFSNRRVVNRINNFSLLRCRLCVRVLINGNPFYYGRMLVSYVPLHLYDQVSYVGTDSIDLITASQRPHIYLDPTNSQGGSLCLPFVWPDNSSHIPTGNIGALGILSFREMNSLRHANGGTEPIDVTVFAWAEDLVLSAPTLEPCAFLVPQAGQDEYGTGPISRPAGVIARIASSLRSTPIVAPYARATELAASTVSSIAQMFGYSRPNVISEITQMKPVFVGNLANTNVCDTSMKLTLDCKAETTVDTRVMGLSGADEMTITSITTRESYYNTFVWPQNAQPETLLFNAYVTPMMYQQAFDGSYHFTPTCFASLPFNQWRGTLRYRFQVVCSNFHKGRLKIVYDPVGVVSPPEYNAQYTRIIDISSERDFTIDIGWAARKSFLRIPPLVPDPNFSNTVPLPDGFPFSNGVIAVYVVNNLTAPNDSVINDVDVNCFMCSTPDFELVEPTDGKIELLSLFPNPTNPNLARNSLDSVPGREKLMSPPRSPFFDRLPDDGVPDKDLVLEPQAGPADDAPAPVAQESQDTICESVDVTDKTLHVLYGDPVVSLRQLFKRYSIYRLVGINPQNGNGLRRYTFSQYQNYRGYCASGSASTQQNGSIYAYNFVLPTLVSWFTPAYACVRGGMRYKAMVTGAQGNSNNNFILANRRSSDNIYFTDQNIFPSNVDGPRTIANYCPSGVAGQCITHTPDNGVIEYELPYYSPDRFQFGRYITKENIIDTQYRSDSYSLVNFGNFTTSFGGILLHSAAAEDYTLGFFVACPVMYQYANPSYYGGF
jgi:hypothetical protein